MGESIDCGMQAVDPAVVSGQARSAGTDNLGILEPGRAGGEDKKSDRPGDGSPQPSEGPVLSQQQQQQH